MLLPSQLVQLLSLLAFARGPSAEEGGALPACPQLQGSYECRFSWLGGLPPDPGYKEKWVIRQQALDSTELFEFDFGARDENLYLFTRRPGLDAPFRTPPRPRPGFIPRFPCFGSDCAANFVFKGFPHCSALRLSVRGALLYLGGTADFEATLEPAPGGKLLVRQATGSGPGSLLQQAFCAPLRADAPGSH